jgi:hypothetical protein
MQAKMQVMIKEKPLPGVNIVNIVRPTNQDVIYEVWGPPMTALTDY